MIEVIFLGTSAMVPTKDRNASSILINYNEELLLFDCGEGTQRQMNIANVNRNRVKKIFITHWHGDHVAGLIGLIQTIGNQLNQDNKNKKNKKNNLNDEYDDEVYKELPSLEIFGPIGTKEHMDHLLKTCIFDNRVNIKIKEFDCPELKKIIETEDYYIDTINLDHKAKCLGYSFIEKDRIKIKKEYLTKHKIPEGPHLKNLSNGKNSVYKGITINVDDATFKTTGKKITFVIDTCACNNAILLAKNSDVLISESSYKSDLEDKAAEYKHMTSKDAAYLAVNSNSKKLILTHISQRYKSCDELVNDAKLIFEDTICAHDFLKIKI